MRGAQVAALLFELAASSSGGSAESGMFEQRPLHLIPGYNGPAPATDGPRPLHLSYNDFVPDADTKARGVVQTSHLVSEANSSRRQLQVFYFQQPCVQHIECDSHVCAG